MGPLHSPNSASHLAARLRFRHLQMLVALQRKGSLRAAADELNLSQPAISKALGEVESMFGIALFTRTPRGMTPTPAGEITIRSATWMLAEVEHVRREALASGHASAILRVGSTPIVAQTFLPAVLKRLGDCNPPVHVYLLEDAIPALVQALEAAQLDALITSYAAPAPGSGSARLHHEYLFNTEFIVIAPPHHVLTRARQVGWTALARERWIMPAWSSMMRHVLEDAFLHAGATPPIPVVESINPFSSVQMVAAGVGLGIVPAASARHALSLHLVRVVRVNAAIAPRPVALIHRAGPQNPRVELLREALGLSDRPAC